MPNMMELMLGGNTDQRTMQALAGQLRRKREASNLAMLSGDPTLQGFGGVLREDMQLQQKLKMDQAEKAAQRELTSGYYDQLAENSAFNKTMSQRRQVEIERHNRAMEEAAAIRSSGANAGKIPTASAQEKTNEVIAGLQNIKNLGETFQDHYGSSTSIAGGSATNVLGKTPLSTDAMKEQALWWSQYDLLYTLPVRNQLFGSALTAQERAAWRKANISPNSPPDVIRKGIKNLTAIAEQALSRQYIADAASYDPEWVGSVYGQVDIPAIGGSKQTPPPEEKEEVVPPTPQSGKEVAWSDTKP